VSQAEIFPAIIFFSCAAAILVGALAVILARNPVHSALFLLMTLVSVAVLFLQLNAALVAAVQIVVYASAIVVLFLFVITLLGVDKHERLPSAGRIQGPTAVALGVLFLAGVVGIANDNWVTGIPSEKHPIGKGGDEVYNVSKALFTDYIWAFEIVAVLLVIAVVGGVVLARRSGQKSERPEAEHVS
jgi:NADH-quinone oxidoreductase subunit J